MWKPLHDFIAYNLAWYTGAVWPNVWAAGVLAVPGLPFLFWRMRKHLERHKETLVHHILGELTGEESEE